MSKKILLVGGGGHCKSVLDTLLERNNFSDIGIIDKKENVGEWILGIPIIGCDNDLPQLFDAGYKYAFVTVGSVGDTKLRIRLYDKLMEVGFEIPNIIDPTAIVSSHIHIETGIYIGKKSIINAGSTIKKGAIINTGAIIEHDCMIEEFVHVAPGAILCGEVKVGSRTHIGANSVIKQQLVIGSDSVIGVGSIVTKNIEDNIIAYGNPCKGVVKR